MARDIDNKKEQARLEDNVLKAARTVYMAKRLNREEKYITAAQEWLDEQTLALLKHEGSIS